MEQEALKKVQHHTGLDRLFRYAEFLGFGDIHFKIDHASGLHAIVAIHNLKRGPAIGGCRFVHYDTTDDALEDVLRLGYMMSYKAAISNLNHGGAKSVILLPKVIKDREALFEAFGGFVNELGGRYITAVDSGTSPADMDIIARKTRFVTCTSDSAYSADPSPETAFGVRRAIEAAVKFKMNRDHLKGLRVSIQGAGQVGYYLARELKQLGAELIMCDKNAAALKRCVDELHVQTCHIDEIFDVDADIFAPCALGAVLNLDTIRQLKVSIVAGSANNQLGHYQYGKALMEAGILYAPDFVINAGGLIHVAEIYDHADARRATQQIANIYETSMSIFMRAAAEGRSTVEIAEAMAVERLR